MTDTDTADVRDRLTVLLDEGCDDLAAALLADHRQECVHLVTLGELAAAF